MGMKEIVALFQHRRIGTVEDLIGNRDISPDGTSMHHHSLTTTGAPMAGPSESPVALLAS